jgi:hypothetical protein
VKVSPLYPDISWALPPYYFITFAVTTRSLYLTRSKKAKLFAIVQKLQKVFFAVFAVFSCLMTQKT